MSDIKFMGVTGNYIAQKAKHDDHIIVLCRILSVGNYTDMNGQSVPVDEKRLIALTTNYNTRLEDEFKKHKQSILEHKDELDPSIVTCAESMIIDEFDFLPNQIDHDLGSVKSTVGNVMGKMFLKKSLGKMAIFCYIKVKGKENVQCVINDTWRNLSAGFDMELNKFNEVSWVTWGADPNANKILGDPIIGINASNNVNLINSSVYGLMLQAEDLIIELNQKIFIKQRSIALCKSRKITQADRQIIEAKLSSVKDLRAINNLFDILDEYIPFQSLRHKFVLMGKSESDLLLETINAASNPKIYALK